MGYELLAKRFLDLWRLLFTPIGHPIVDSFHVVPDELILAIVLNVEVRVLSGLEALLRRVHELTCLGQVEIWKVLQVNIGVHQQLDTVQIGLVALAQIRVRAFRPLLHPDASRIASSSHRVVRLSKFAQKRRLLIV